MISIQSCTFFQPRAFHRPFSTTDSNYGRVQKGIMIMLLDFKGPHWSTHPGIYMPLEMKTQTFLTFSPDRRLIWPRRNKIIIKGFQTPFADLPRLREVSSVWEKKKTPKTCRASFGGTSNLSVIAVTAPPKLVAAATASWENVFVFSPFVLFSGFCQWKTIL